MSDLSQTLTEQAIGTSAYRDLVISNGDLVLTSDASSSALATDPVGQNIIQRLLQFVGEYFLNTQEGVPYHQSIFVKGAKQSDVDAILQERILGTPGVSVLTAFESQNLSAQRIYRVSFSVTTTSGALLRYNLPLGNL